MRAITITRSARGGPVTPNVKTVEDWPEPKAPEPGQALVQTICSALNHMDLWVGMGIPGVDLTYPRVSGCDACGEIISVGDGVDPSWIGQCVVLNAAVAMKTTDRAGDPPASTMTPDYELIGEHSSGVHAERFLAPVSNLATVGADADSAQAAAFGLTMLTAYSMMFTKGQLRPGQSVLITGIGGGVATAALRLARWIGCRIIVTSRHQWKLDKAIEAGADFGVLDSGSDWSGAIRAHTNKRGVDMAIDTVGKATHLSCVKSLARGGAYVTAGCTTGPDATTDLARLFWSQLRILGSTMGSNDEFREVVSLFRDGSLRPVVDSIHPWRDAQSAWRRLEDAEQFGKIVIQWTQPQGA